MQQIMSLYHSDADEKTVLNALQEPIETLNFPKIYGDF